jgi:pimeloyl-ACP methyl ester carboxylesterase
MENVMEEPGKGFRIDAVQAGGFTLKYAEAGPSSPKATIVSLPGSGGLEMSTAKDILAQSYRVIELNPPGWGDQTDLDRPMAQSELGGILAEAIRKLVRGPYYLIGTSMGGANALFVAAIDPDNVLGIIHEGSMAPCRLDDMRLPPPTKEQMDAAYGGGSGAIVPNYPVPPVHPRKPWATTAVMQISMRNRMRMMRLVPADFSCEVAVQAVRDHKIPLLALVGDQDGILKLSQADTYRAELPQTQFVAVPGGEHDLQNTTPEIFVSQVEDFMARHRA